MTHAQRGWLHGSIEINALLSFAFGLTFIMVMLGFVVAFPNPTEIQVWTFVTVLALAAAGVGAVLPGFLTLQHKGAIRAGGALAMFVLVFFFQPTLKKSVINYVAPKANPEPIASLFMQTTDAGDYNAAWSQMDPSTRGLFLDNAEDLSKLYKAEREPLGAVVARQLVGSAGAQSPSGVPVGLYRTLTYKTRFENYEGCKGEAVTLRATQDLQWRVFSHQISPTRIDC